MNRYRISTSICKILPEYHDDLKSYVVLPRGGCKKCDSHNIYTVESPKTDTPRSGQPPTPDKPRGTD